MIDLASAKQRVLDLRPATILCSTVMPDELMIAPCILLSVAVLDGPGSLREVVLTGFLNLTAVRTMGRELIGVCREDSSAVPVLLNLSGLAGLDALGLWGLMAALPPCLFEKQQLALLVDHGEDARLYEAVKATGIVTLLPLFADRSSALAGWAAPRSEPADTTGQVRADSRRKSPRCPPAGRQTTCNPAAKRGSN